MEGKIQINEKRLEERYGFICGGMRRILDTYNFIFLVSGGKEQDMVRDMIKGRFEENNEENRKRLGELGVYLYEYFRNRRAWIEENIGEEFFDIYR